MADAVERNIALHRALIRALLAIALIIVGTTIVLAIREGIFFLRALMIVLLMLAGNNSLLDLGSRATETQVVITVVAYARILIVAIVVATVMDFILRTRFPTLFPRRSKTMKDHIILCGFGQVGYRVLDELEQFDIGVIVIDEDASGPFVTHLSERKVPTVFEDARNSDVLIRAGIEDARALIACTDNDLTNVEIALDAREIRPDIRVVLRLFDQRLASKISKGFDIKLGFSAAALAAPAFAAAAVDPTVVDTFYVGNRLYVFSEFWVTEGCSLANESMWDLAGKYDVTTLSFTSADGEVTWHPGETEKCPTGSKLGVVGSYLHVQELLADHGIIEPAAKVKRELSRDGSARAGRYEKPSRFIDQGR